MSKKELVGYLNSDLKVKNIVPFWYAYKYDVFGKRTHELEDILEEQDLIPLNKLKSKANKYISPNECLFIKNTNLSESDLINKYPSVTFTTDLSKATTIVLNSKLVDQIYTFNNKLNLFKKVVSSNVCFDNSVIDKKHKFVYIGLREWDLRDEDEKYTKAVNELPGKLHSIKFRANPGEWKQIKYYNSVVEETINKGYSFIFDSDLVSTLNKGNLTLDEQNYTNLSQMLRSTSKEDINMATEILSGLDLGDEKTKYYVYCLVNIYYNNSAFNYGTSTKIPPKLNIIVSELKVQKVKYLVWYNYINHIVKNNQVSEEGMKILNEYAIENLNKVDRYQKIFKVKELEFI